MKKYSYRWFVVIAALCSCGSSVYAAPKSALKLCVNNASGTIIAKNRCSKAESVLSVAALQQVAASSVAGLKGDVGAQGPAGTLDPSKCTTRQGFGSDVLVAVARVDCLPGEFLLTHGITSSDLNSLIIESVLMYRPGEQTASGVQYKSGKNMVYEKLFTISVDAVCCKP